MKAVFEKNTDAGVPLSRVKPGTVVRMQRSADTLYLVTAMMNGTGAVALVTLGGGTLKEHVSLEALVMPMDATCVVHGALDPKACELQPIPTGPYIHGAKPFLSYKTGFRSNSAIPE